VQMRSEGASYLTIAKSIFRSADGVKGRYARITGKAPPMPFTINDDLEIERLTNEGHTPTQIGAMLGNRTGASIEERLSTLVNYVGKTMGEFMLERNMSRKQAADWLFRRGYDFTTETIVKRQTVFELEDEITKRIIMAPRPVACWRCGCRDCSHIVADWSPAQVAA